MLKNIKHLLKRGLITNMALGLIALPTASTKLIIPQTELDTAFNIQTTTIAKTDTVQIPVDFLYVSQGFSAFHPGIDLPSEYASPVKPIKYGIVEEAGYSPFGYGNEVLISHDDGMESLYAHLSKIEVKKGDEVDINTIIGLVGSTGHSTGPHLHLEIHMNGKAVNPRTILPPLTKESPKLLSSM